MSSSSGYVAASSPPAYADRPVEMGASLECVFLNAFETGSEARAGIGRWINYYNRKRPHSSFDGRTPDEVYATEEMMERLAA